MNPGLVVKLRPAGPWRIGPDSGARNRVDFIYHSDSLYSAVTSAMARMGTLDAWLDATARGSTPAVCFSSCFPFLDEIGFVVPPRTIWPPHAKNLMSARVRWKSARFVPLGIVQAILAGQRLDENHWSVDGASECLVPAGRPGPFRTGVRWSAAVDRLTGSTERHSTACIEFRPGAGLWTIVSFVDSAAHERWSEPVKAAFRLLADTGFGGERSRGWGRSETPEFIDGVLPEMILPAVTEVVAESAAEPSEIPPEEPAISPAEPSPSVAVTGPPAQSVPEPPAAEASEPESVAVASEEEVREVIAEAAEMVAEGAPPEPPPSVAMTEVLSEVLAAEPLEPAQMAEPAAEGPQAAVLAEPAEMMAEGAMPEPPPAEAIPDASPAEAAEPVAEPAVEDPRAEVIAEATEMVAEGAPPEPPPAESAEPAVVVSAEPEITEGSAAVSGLSDVLPLVVTPPAPEPEPVTSRGPSDPVHPHWLLSLFTPAEADAVDWRRGNYTVLARGGRVDSPAGSGELKKQIQMVAEGSVVYAPAGPCGSAADVAPDGFAHPVFRAGFAVSIPLPEVS